MVLILTPCVETIQKRVYWKDLKKKKIKHEILNFKLFQHIKLKFDIIWMRIGKVIKIMKW